MKLISGAFCFPSFGRKVANQWRLCLTFPKLTLFGVCFSLQVYFFKWSPIQHVILPLHTRKKCCFSIFRKKESHICFYTVIVFSEWNWYNVKFYTIEMCISATNLPTHQYELCLGCARNTRLKETTPSWAQSFVILITGNLTFNHICRIGERLACVSVKSIVKTFVSDITFCWRMYLPTVLCSRHILSLKKCRKQKRVHAADAFVFCCL